MKLSGTMIVRGGSEPGGFVRSLKSLVPFVDEMCVVCTRVGDQSAQALHMAATTVCQDLDVPLRWSEWTDAEGNEEEGWISSFAEARNRALDMVTGDVWCWLDADTLLVNGEQWREDIEKHFGEDPSVGLMSVRYMYDHDDKGRCVRQSVSRMVFRTGVAGWRYPVHEQPEFIRRVRPVDGTRAKYHLRHDKPRAEHERSTERNWWILENYMQSGGEMDAHMWMSVAQTQIGREEYGSALAALRECLSLDPMDGDKWNALSALGGVLNSLGHYDEALAPYGEMAALHPERATPWVCIAQTLCDAGRHAEALAAVARAMASADAPEGPSHNPDFLAYSPLYTAARCYAALGDFAEAINAFERLLILKPEFGRAREHMEALKEQYALAETYEQFKGVAAASGPAAWNLAPDSLYNFPEVAKARLPERPDALDTVMIFCGPGAAGCWGPSDLETGLGGSEEAVVYLSRELVRLGYHVEVYAAPRLEECGTDEHGVVWAPWAAWEDREGHFIQWRGTNRLEAATRASARYVWLHDVIVQPEVYTDDLKEVVDGVFCLSEFHAGPLRERGWDDKVILTKNGLPPAVLERPLGERRRNSFAYYSSPDRGLDKLLEVWRDIRYAIPEATLDIYYGFTSFYLKQMERHPSLRALKEKIEGQLRDLEGCGVTWHGMVGHEELHESMATTDFWLYPTRWPETSAITAMKCMALGCIPITSGYPDSGMVETLGGYDLGADLRLENVYDDPSQLEAWKDCVIEAAKAEDPMDRMEMVTWAREQYDWQAVATHWVSIFPVSGESRQTAPSDLSPAAAS